MISRLTATSPRVPRTCTCLRPDPSSQDRRDPRLGRPRLTIRDLSGQPLLRRAKEIADTSPVSASQLGLKSLGLGPCAGHAGVVDPGGRQDSNTSCRDSQATTTRSTYSSSMLAVAATHHCSDTDRSPRSRSSAVRSPTTQDRRTHRNERCRKADGRRGRAGPSSGTDRTAAERMPSGPLVLDMERCSSKRGHRCAYVTSGRCC